MSDRTEARLVASETERYAEAATTPGVSLGLEWQHVSLSLGYAPSVLVTPLEREPRDVFFLQAVSAGIQYARSWKRTTLVISETASFAQHQYRRELLNPLQGPLPPPADGGTTPDGSNPPGGATPPAGAPGAQPPGGDMSGGNAGGADAAAQTAALQDDPVSIASSSTSVSLSRLLSRRTTLAGNATYSVTGGVNEQSRLNYPLIHGPTLSLSAVHRLDRKDTVSTLLTTQYSMGKNAPQAVLAALTGRWDHQFTRRTVGSAGVGFSGAWTDTPAAGDNLELYPTGTLGLAHFTTFARGDARFAVAATAEPVVDRTTGYVDPRVNFGGDVGWVRDRLSIGANASLALSLRSDSPAALNSVATSLALGYDIGAGFSTDAGVRAAWQEFGGETQVPVTWAAFVGIQWGAAVEVR